MAKSKKAEIEQMELNELLFTLIAQKVGSVDPKEVFSVVKNPQTAKYTGFFGTQKLSQGELSQLKQEVDLFKQTSLYKLITKNLYYEAELKMLKNAKTERDMDWGKALMHSVGVIENTLFAIENTEME